MSKSARWAGVMAVFGMAGAASGITLQFDYTYDTNGFFDSQSRRDLMELAGESFSIFTDSLAAIEPGPSGFGFDNTWDAVITHPGTGAEQRIKDLVVPADTLVIFVGGRDLPGTRLGSGGSGGFSSSGTTQWLNTVRERGQGDRQYDFAPWGGQVAFDMPADWSYSASSGPGNDETDFLSVAIHELTHLFGFSYGTESFREHIDGSSFTGSAAKAVYGGNVPLASDRSHWLAGTDDVTAGTDIVQETALDPNITDGDRKLLTDLDYAALMDVGWEIPVEIVRSGDMNQDTVLDAFDVADFESALASPDVFMDSVGISANVLADLDGSGVFDAFDVDDFEARLATGGLVTVPSPSSMLVLVFAGVLGLRRKSGRERRI